jgi:hypothetical protein
MSEDMIVEASACLVLSHSSVKNKKRKKSEKKKKEIVLFKLVIVRQRK